MAPSSGSRNLLEWLAEFIRNIVLTSELAYNERDSGMEEMQRASCAGRTWRFQTLSPNLKVFTNLETLQISSPGFLWRFRDLCILD